jgi:ligand-binding sensor domain-containing protein
LSGLSFKSSLPGIALLFFSIVGAEAQPSRFFHLNMANGLSDNFVSSLAIDKQGFLWIGTLEGLNVFDGYSITSYFKKRQPELASNNIIHLTCDRNNRIWMGSNEGASWLDEKRIFHRVIVQDTIKDFVCRTILDTKKYGPVVFTSLGQFFLNATKHKWEKLNLIPNQVRYQLFSDAEHLSEDKFIYGTSEGVVLFDYATNKMIFEMPMKGIVSLCRYSDHEIAVALRNDGVTVVDINTKRIVKEFPLTRQLNNRSEKTVLDEIRPAINNTLLIGTDHAGLIMIDSSDNISWLLHDPINSNSIGSNHVRRLLCSEQGDILIGSTIAGVSSFDLLNRVSGYKNMFHDGHGNFYDSYIADITEDKKGVLWMGGFEKMIAWDRKNNDVKFYKYYSEVEGYGYEIRAICIDSLGRKWAGSLNNGLSLLNEEKGNFISIPLDSTKGEALKDKNILDLQTASDGIIWASTLKGIFTIDSKTFETNTFSDHPELKQFAGQRIDYFYEDRNKRMWLATHRQGLFCYDKAHDKLIHYSIENGLAATRCFAIYQDKRQNIYAATNTGFSVISANGTISSYGLKDGLRYDACYGVLEDEKGAIWFSNVKCLARFDPVSKKIEIYDQNKGLTPEQFRPGSFFKSMTGELLWGSRSGLNYFFSEQLTARVRQLKVNITYADLNDSLFYLAKGDRFKLKYTKNNVLFRFAAIGLQGSVNVHYRYKLEGYNTDWQEAINLHIVRYSLLPAGEYTFKVQASQDGVNWTEASNDVVLRVVPPLWKQWWFITLFSIFITSIFILYLRNRNQKLKRKQEELETEQAIHYFTSSMSEQQTEEEILWDVAKNCIGRLHFEDCVIYMKDEKRNVFVQKAANGLKRDSALTTGQAFELKPGEGIVGSVALTGHAEIVNDTTKEKRYIIGIEKHLSEISVPIIYNGNVLGVIDCEHSKKMFFTQKHLSILTTIASLCANRIVRARAEKEKREAKSILMDTQRKMTEVEMQALRAQMNPHFIFNCLNSINRYIVKSDQTTASLYLTKFAKLIRLILDNSNSKNVILTNELEALKLYIEMEALRFDKKFTYEVKVENGLSTDSVELPPLIIQPYVENAIWHGLLHKESGGHLSVRLSMSGESLLNCVIEDNGVGREKAKELRSKSATSRKSLGMQLTEHRLSLLNKHAELNASIEIIDMSNGHGEASGTKVILKIPV